MKKLKLVSLLLNTPPPLASSLLYYYFILILWTFFCFFDKTRKRCSLRVITSTNKISAGAIQSCIFKQVKELTIWMVNLSSLFFSHEYVSYAFIASPMSHLCEPLLWIKLNDFVIPFFFCRRSWISESIRNLWRAQPWPFKTCFQRETPSGKVADMRILSN